jgi:hypothetical protein
LWSVCSPTIFRVNGKARILVVLADLFGEDIINKLSNLLDGKRIGSKLLQYDTYFIQTKHDYHKRIEPSPNTYTSALIQKHDFSANRATRENTVTESSLRIRKTEPINAPS